MSQKHQNDSKDEFTGSPSETESHSDSAEGTEGEDKVSASSVIYSSKSSWQPFLMKLSKYFGNFAKAVKWSHKTFFSKVSKIFVEFKKVFNFGKFLIYVLPRFN